MNLSEAKFSFVSNRFKQICFFSKLNDVQHTLVFYLGLSVPKKLNRYVARTNYIFLLNMRSL